MADITLKVNGDTKTASVPPETTLLKLLREDFNLTGAKVGCDVAVSYTHLTLPTKRIV